MKECPQCYHAYDDDMIYCPEDGTIIQPTLPGSVLIEGKYRLDRFIAQGSMGRVYTAEQPDLQRWVAIKILNPQLLASSVARERFRREALASGSLKHPNIITVYDFASTTKGLFYIAMELLEGQTLADRLAQQTRMDVNEVVRIALEIADGLTQAHAQGLIHRDLKPSNIYLHQAGDVKITKVIDFGLVKLKEHSATFKSITSGALVGSLHYSAPEQCRSVDIDARADIYSLGAIFYHMLTGQQPFDNPNKMQLIYQLLNTKPLPPHRIVFDIPPMLEAVVMKALEKDPDARYQSMEEFATALRQAPKRNARRTVGMFLPTAIESAKEYLAQELEKASQRPLNFDHFVGRKRERSKIELAFEQANEGRSVALLVAGDPGIGKSALLNQVITELKDSTPYCFAGQFSEVVTSVWTLTNLRNYLYKLQSNEPEKLKQLLGGIYEGIVELLSEERQALPTATFFRAGGEGRADRTLELLSQVLLTLSEDQPVVLALDDIHLADEVNLNFIMRLIGSASASRILFIFTARTQEIARPETTIANWLDRMSSQRQLQRLNLAALSTADAQAFIEKVCEPIAIAEAAINKLTQVTEGNPFYLVNLIHLMVEEGQITWNGTHWTCHDVTEIRLPDTITRLIETRLNFLAANSQPIIELASILGETFSFNILRKFADINENDLLKFIDDALRYGLIKEVLAPSGNTSQDDYYSFTQQAIYQVVYDRRTPEERQEQHLKAAKLLSEYNSDQTAGEAARQYLLSGDYPEAFSYLVMVAHKAWREGEVSLARQHLQKGRTLVAEIEILTQLADPNIEIPDSQVKLATSYCDYLMLSVDLKVYEKPTQAEQALKEALAIAEKLTDALVKARILVASAHYHQYIGDYIAAVDNFEQALALYEKLGNRQRYNVVIEQLQALRAKVKTVKPTADII